MTLPAFFMLAARRMSLFNATEASARSCRSRRPRRRLRALRGRCRADDGGHAGISGACAGVGLAVNLDHPRDVVQAGIALRLEERTVLPMTLALGGGEFGDQQRLHFARPRPAASWRSIARRWR